MHAFVVKVDFITVNPLTGVAEMHTKGDVITHPKRVAALYGSELENHIVKIHLPDSHQHTGSNVERPAVHDDADAA